MNKNSTHPYLQSWPRIITLLFLLGCYTYALQAQQFKVRRFRALTNDITAYINPVKDLNEEACALIKVVGNNDFAFSSPLGIVRQVHEVGEIWIYLPNGSRQLTIKHPQWGVLRDYRFPFALESRMTYELVVAPTVEAAPLPIPRLKDEPSRIDTTAHQIATLTPHPASRIRRPREPWYRLAMATVGIGSGNPTYGVRIGCMRRHGAYLGVQTDFQGGVSTQDLCLEDGALAADPSIYPYYTGKTKEQAYRFTLGGMHRLFSECCLYEGIGYGQRKVAWETADRGWLENQGYSTKGFSAELGCFWRFRKWVVAAGVSTIQADYWEATLGIGIRF